MSRLLIWGAGGHGKVVLDIAVAMDAFAEIAFIDDAFGEDGDSYCGRPLLRGDIENIVRGCQSGNSFIAAVGDNDARARCFNGAVERGLIPATLIHPLAVVSPAASIGRGTVILPRAVVNAGAVIGEDCIINTGAIVEHDCKVGNHTHISSGTVLGGGVMVGGFVLVGLGAVALPKAEIGEAATVGAGAVVIGNVAGHATVVGVPARLIRRKRGGYFSGHSAIPA